MTTPLLLRAADFEVSGDGRTIEGQAFAWDHPSMVTDDGGRTRYLEEFAQRCADQTLRMRALRPLFVEHEHILGSVGETTFVKAASGLMFRARASDSTYAAATLERIHNGELPEVSIGFKPVRNLKRSDPRGVVTTRVEIKIAELSLTRQGQHAGAEVQLVRSESGTPRLDVLRKRKLLLLV